MNINTNYITYKGFLEMKNKLTNMEKQSNEIMQQIKEARKFMDYSENSELQYATQEYNIISKKIQDIKHILYTSEIINTNDIKNKDIINIGATIILKNNKKIIQFQIVGEHEANPDIGSISYKSIVGKQLLGLTYGDKITIQDEIFNIQEIIWQ